jgi:hypothetical protein
MRGSVIFWGLHVFKGECKKTACHRVFIRDDEIFLRLTVKEAV